MWVCVSVCMLENGNHYIACNISWLLLNLWSVAVLQQCLNIQWMKYNTIKGCRQVLWVLKWF